MRFMKPPAPSWLRDPWFWGLCLAACLLLLPHLESSGVLWQDEGETAVLAKNTLQFGYPKAFDGINRVNPSVPIGPHAAWTYHTWLQFYVAAASFWAFGATTMAARLPFALAGVLGVLLAYRVTLALFEHCGIARLTSLFVLCSVPLMLHARQCRYYALAVLGVLWVLWAYLKIHEGRRRAWWWLAAGLLFLFHSHHGAFIPTLAAVVLDSWRRGILPLHRRTAVLTVGAFLLLLAPWPFILDISQHQGKFVGRELAHHAQFYLRELNHFVIPLQFFVLAWLLRGIRPLAWWKTASARHRDALGLVLLLVGCHLAFFVAVPWQRHFRYLIQIFPLLYLLQAALLWRWLGARRGWLALITVTLIATDLLHYSAPYLAAQAIPRLQRKIVREHGLVAPQSLLWEYGHELTHRYRGPLDGIVETLRREAHPGDTVKIPYGEMPLMFYTGLRLEDPNRFATPTSPNWIIPRRDWVSEQFWRSPYFRTIEQQYERLELNVPDLIWENRPDPGYHKFRTVTDAPPLVIYRRRAPAP